MISPTSSLIYFILWTTIYFVLKYYLSEKYDQRTNRSMGIALTAGYLVIMLLMQLATNLANAKEKCGGTPQIIAAINYTIIPNLFIFGGLLMAMLFFPGWKEPFSNTIGYGILNSIPSMIGMESMGEVFIKILGSGAGQNKLLRMVTDDPSIMINEITPENFNLFIAKMGGKQGGITSLPVGETVDTTPSAPKMGGGRKYKQKGGGPSILSSGYKKYLPDLYNLVVLKDRIAEWFWYILTGYLVIQNSNSYVNSIKCKRSPEELEAKLANNLSKPKKKKEVQKWALGY